MLVTWTAGISETNSLNSSFLACFLWLFLSLKQINCKYLKEFLFFGRFDNLIWYIPKVFSLLINVTFQVLSQLKSFQALSCLTYWKFWNPLTVRQYSTTDPLYHRTIFAYYSPFIPILFRDFSIVKHSLNIVISPSCLKLFLILTNNKMCATL